MIFVAVGTQKFQLNRLLKEIDDLISQGKLQDEVFAQTGHSDYIPKTKTFYESSCLGTLEGKITIIESK
jgi:UDP-N-acetylglucosamine transferase subunit ALG13